MARKRLNRKPKPNRMEPVEPAARKPAATSIEHQLPNVAQMPQINIRESDASEFKFPTVVEQTVQGIVDIVFQCATTWWLLCRHPWSFLDRSTNSAGIARPFTFLTLAVLVSAGHTTPLNFSNLLRGASLVSTLQKRFREFSLESLLTQTLPTVFYIICVAALFDRFSRGSKERTPPAGKAVYYTAGFLFISSFILTVVNQIWRATLWARWELRNFDDDYNPSVGEIIIGIGINSLVWAVIASCCYLTLYTAVRRSVTHLLVRIALPAIAVVAIMLSGTVTSSARRLLETSVRLEEFQRGEHLISEDDSFIVDGYVDSASGKGHLSWVFRNSSDDLSCLRSPLELTISCSSKSAGEFVCELSTPDVEIVNWSAAQAPVLEVAHDQRGWLGIAFQIRDETMREMLRLHGTHALVIDVSCHLTLMSPPAHRLHSRESTNNPEFFYATYPLRISNATSTVKKPSSDGAQAAEH
jgi:hypothetical protein